MMLVHKLKILSRCSELALFFPILNFIYCQSGNYVQENEVYFFSSM